MRKRAIDWRAEGIVRREPTSRRRILFGYTPSAVNIRSWLHVKSREWHLGPRIPLLAKGREKRGTPGWSENPDLEVGALKSKA